MADPLETDGEGNYLSSVSDLMAGLLFVLILAVFAFALQLSTVTRDAEQQRAQMEEQRRRQEAELVGLRRATEEELLALRAQVGESLGAEVQRLEEALNSARARRAALLTGMQAALEQRGVPVSVDAATGVLRLSDRMLFASGRSDLPPGSPAREVVRALADVLGQTLPCFATGADSRSNCGPAATPIIDAVFIEGHTDRRRLGTGERDGNYELSANRALSTYGVMQSLRPDLWELRNAQGVSLMGVSGYGPDRPVAGRLSDREDDLAANRRIEIRFLLATPAPPELRSLRGRLERITGGLPSTR
ncbi:OmpA/MotB family protein [Belnapia rosea]|uniref:OmpA/MotB family protein n=1 Tax=Belnapia rosea TaxID=938405 RepID=UPI00087FE5D7|nr:hypothetical protein [Belnapia rosea]SDB20501.1 Flagellar motor protein MotB [Belnapia rosea]